MPHAPLPIPLTITQHFGERPDYYKKYGLAGHNGLDLHAPSGTPFIAMLPGVWHLLTQKNWRGQWIGYGAAWRLDFNEGGGRVQQLTFGHLQHRRLDLDRANLPDGRVLAETDNTGDSTAPHLHIGLKLLISGVVQNYNNGFHGSVDPLPFLKSIGLTFTNG